MGTVVGLAAAAPLPAEGLRRAVARLHEADRVFSTWEPDSPLSRLRSGLSGPDELAPADRAAIEEVLGRCVVAREMTDGAFDPWVMPGGVDPTGLVKGWAAAAALEELRAAGAGYAIVNAGGDIAVFGRPGGACWRVGIRHPSQPESLCAVVEVATAVATSGNYERPGDLVDPKTGRTARGVVSATVTGPELDLADALATGLAVAGRPLLARIEQAEGYEAHLVTSDGRHFATPGMAFSS